MWRLYPESDYSVGQTLFLLLATSFCSLLFSCSSPSPHPYWKRLRVERLWVIQRMQRVLSGTPRSMFYTITLRSSSGEKLRRSHDNDDMSEERTLLCHMYYFGNSGELEGFLSREWFFLLLYPTEKRKWSVILVVTCTMFAMVLGVIETLIRSR